MQKTGETEVDQFIPMFGYDLLREDVLPDLLGSDHQQIMYWAGKSLARKYRVTSVEHLEDFFKKAGFGDLTLVKMKRTVMIFELVSTRFNHKKTISAPLEAGFLAQQVETIKGHIAETLETPKTGKSPKIIFEVKWDPTDDI